MDPAFELDQSNPSQSGLTPTIQNIVCTVDLDVRGIDLMSMTKKARNAEYNPRRFKAVIMRIREPKTTSLIFTSGKLLCTGAKSEHDARTAARKYARIVQKLGYPQARFKNFCIHNIVGSCDVRFSIRLEVLCVNQHAFARYDPEVFPGLLYRMTKPMVTILVFKSGKVVITGTKRKEEIFEAFENIYPVLKECSRDNYKR